MTEAKRYWAALQLLDRQLIDRDGKMCGNVDDVELELHEDGTVHVSALLSGPGVLAPRIGLRRLGDWLRRAHAIVEGDGDDPARIALARVADIGDHVTVSLHREDLGTFHGERWVRDHLIGRIPGSRHAPPAE
jgi:sporulation protein YlmC with PRC-barrel domain